MTKHKKQPVNQAEASPLTGIVPPMETRWKPGQSGNKSGRPAAGLSVREWLNQMADWTEARVRKVLRSKRSPLNQRAAARTWLDAISEDRTNSGNPIAGPEMDRICDQTAGKPVQAVEHSGPEGGPIKTENNFDHDAFRRAFADFARQRLPADGDGPAPANNS